MFDERVYCLQMNDRSEFSDEMWNSKSLDSVRNQTVSHLKMFFFGPFQFGLIIKHLILLFYCDLLSQLLFGNKPCRRAGRELFNRLRDIRCPGVTTCVLRADLFSMHSRPYFISLLVLILKSLPATRERNSIDE